MRHILKEKLSLFGYVISRKEVLLNSIAFFVLRALYSSVVMVSQIPGEFKNNPEVINNIHFQTNPVINFVLFILGYALMDFAIFGGGRASALIQEKGFLNYLVRKVVILISQIIFVVIMEIFISVILVMIFF